MSNEIGIYIHVPFCNGKCPYCDFFSVSCNDSIMDDYVKKICDDIRKWKKLNRRANTLYLGGGTPGLLGSDRIKKIVEAVSMSFSLFEARDVEITVELNPTNAYQLDFKSLLNCGVNRLSIGLQSSNDKELSLLGRKHTSNTARYAVESAQAAGFNNISLDLMIATPSQTKDSLIESINFCNKMKVQHISMYMLKIEPGTKYYSQKDSLILPNEDQECDLYMLACNYAERLGFSQYEISNFSKKGFEGRHNLKYWNAQEYLGLGPSAHSFIDGKRFYYDRSIKKFFNDDPLMIEGPGGDEQEYIFLRLRLAEGLKNAKFKKRFGYSIPKRYFQNAYRYQKLGLTKVSDETICLTKKGFLLSNKLISELLD